MDNNKIIMEIIKMIKDFNSLETVKLIGDIEDAKDLQYGGCEFCCEDLYREEDGTLITNSERR